MSLITVRKNLLTCADFQFRCAIGKGGFSNNKHEGDGCTPVGTLALRECWFRADRISTPKTGLPLREIRENDGWSDDPRSEDYNRHILIPSPSGRGQGEGPYAYTKPELIKRARELRSDCPAPEKIMWSILRNRQMNGCKFRRQHPIPPYVADFFCDELKLIIELDGDQHGTDEGLAKDARRSKFLENIGYKVMRFSNHEMRENLEGVLEKIFLLTEEGVRALTLTLSQGEREYSYEKLWREDHVYDLIIPMGYNDNPVVAGKGSAIFMHIAKPDYAGTEGCIALAQADLLSILPHLTTRSQIEIRAE